MPVRWRDAMERALYGPDGFFVSGSGPAAHFRTSVHASPAFAAALLRLVEQVDAALGHPDRLDVVDVGAGRGELLRALSATLEAATHSAPVGPRPGSARPSPATVVLLAHRVRLTAVERAPRPDGLSATIGWVDDIPDGITGVLLATEWLDNVPLDVAVHADGWRYLLVDPTTGEEIVGDRVDPADADWLDRWWPAPTAGASFEDATTTDGVGATARAARPAQGSSLTARSRSDRPETLTAARAEIGRTRDEAWAAAVRHVDRGLALAVDYGHLRDGRPVDGTLTGYRGGRQVPPVPDGSRDVTAHVAVDSVASAGARVARCAYDLVSQREALRALGADGGRPPLSLAAGDPAGYVRALAAASAVAELTDPAGLGGHWWLRQPVGVDPGPFMARWRT
ncbi:SAM-dependent methyltransferase [Micromonospora peucetia]|uniref:SAM-dependent methyltransferase n=1 Tax=Micromonospora peucetia TaxID=47871 RepID=A0A1C6V2S4_9ACTN|nr:SAM-dependent methyltransferase [Micromonospora peucetia]WSA35676.1 SAM-dependent methyltransferase [Micromonospora peucetia]SCL60669.1 SAM-dependent methyltransferase, MidA family [Micromonospora peucetia]